MLQCKTCSRTHTTLGPQVMLPQSVAPPSIILVEDDPPLRTLTARALQEHGYRVRPVATAPEMWAAFDASPVDLVILDIMPSTCCAIMACCRR